MWIRYDKEEYDELCYICNSDDIKYIDLKPLAKWIKKIVDANDEEESIRRR